MNVTDANDQTVSSVSVVLDEHTSGGNLVGRVPCVAGMFLVADQRPNARVTARLAGTSGPFADIGLAPVDLAPYDGTTVEFEFRVEADAAGSPVEYLELPVRVTYNP